VEEIESIDVGVSLATPIEGANSLLTRSPKAATLQILDLFNTIQRPGSDAVLSRPALVSSHELVSDLGVAFYEILRFVGIRFQVVQLPVPISQSYQLPIPLTNRSIAFVLPKILGVFRTRFAFEQR
jgi:hypothetical protein